MRLIAASIGSRTPASAITEAMAVARRERGERARAARSATREETLRGIFAFAAMKQLFLLGDRLHGAGRLCFAWQPDGNFLATTGTNGACVGVAAGVRRGVRKVANGRPLSARPVPPQPGAPRTSAGSGIHTMIEKSG